MYYVYVLYDKNNQFYIGYTNNLKNRIRLHKKGKVISTMRKLPISLLYYEACNKEKDAIKRERYLKSGPGRKYIKYRIRFDLSEMED